MISDSVISSSSTDVNELDVDDKVIFYLTRTSKYPPHRPTYRIRDQNDIPHMLNYYSIDMSDPIHVDGRSETYLDFGLGVKLPRGNFYSEIYYSSKPPLLVEAEEEWVGRDLYDHNPTAIIYPEQNSNISVCVKNRSNNPFFVQEYKRAYFAEVRFGKFVNLDSINIFHTYKNDETDIHYSTEDVSTTSSCRGVFRDTFHLKPNGIPPDVDKNGLCYLLSTPTDISVGTFKSKSVILAITLSLPREFYGRLSIHPKYNFLLTFSVFIDGGENVNLEIDVLNLSMEDKYIKRGEKMFCLNIFRKPAHLRVTYI